MAGNNLHSGEHETIPEEPYNNTQGLLGTPDIEHQHNRANPEPEFHKQSQPVKTGYIFLALEPDGLTYRFLPLITALIEAIEQIREKLAQHHCQTKQYQGFGDAPYYQIAQVYVDSPAGDQATEQCEAEQHRYCPFVPPALETAQQPDNPDDIQDPGHADAVSGQCEHGLVDQAVSQEFL